MTLQKHITLESFKASHTKKCISSRGNVAHVWFSYLFPMKSLLYAFPSSSTLGCKGCDLASMEQVLKLESSRQAGKLGGSVFDYSSAHRCIPIDLSYASAARRVLMRLQLAVCHTHMALATTSALPIELHKVLVNPAFQRHNSIHSR